MPPQILFPYLLFLLILPPHKLPFTTSISDSNALLSFKSAVDPSGQLHFFSTNNHSTSAQCSWPGVTCYSNGRIMRLIFENLSLNGSLQNSSIASLNQLRVLSLKSNSLNGPIPDLSSLLNLKVIFFNNNLFSGRFPSSIVLLHRLRTLDLSHNLLSGSIPSGLTSLDRLYSLRLNSNLLSGALPALNMSSLKIFNVSANDFFGPVPVTVKFSSFGAAAFAENRRLCGAVVLRECASKLPFFKISAAAPSPVARTLALSSVNAASDDGKQKKAFLTVGFFVFGAVLVMLVGGVCLVVREKRKSRGMGKNVVGDVMEGNVERSAEEVEEGCDELVAAAAVTEEKMKRLGKSGSLVFCAGEAQVYSLEQLMRASAEMLGRGSVGSSYKAVLDNRLVLCVKRLDAGKIGVAGKEGFERHMEVVGRLRHPNLVPLRAFFQAKEERLIVYDYQPNGSLHSLIHGMIT